MRIRHRAFVAGVIAAGLSASAGSKSASASIVAKFADGNGTALPDQWTGIGGNGWTGGWTTAGGATGTAGVTAPGSATASPLAGGSSTYLKFVDDAATNTVSARRGFGAADGDVNVSQKYRISFKYRFDGDTSALSVYADRLNLLGDTSSVGSTATTSTWGIGVIGANGTASQTSYPGHWYFYNNITPTAGGAFNAANMVDTGLTLTTGTTYSMTVDVDPVNFSYAATISDGTNPAFTASDLHFRRANTSGAISTAWINFADSASDPADNQSFSVSDLVIVPEPSTAGLLAVGAIGLLRRRRSR